MRLSDFEKYLYSLIGIIVMFLSNKYFVHDYDPSILLTIFSWPFLIIWSAFFYESLSDILVLKYKIIEKENGLCRAKALKFFWLIIVWWFPVKYITKWNKTENIFGAKIIELNLHEKVYKNYDKAVEAINEHKQLIKINRKEFFKRPEKENNGKFKFYSSDKKS